MVDGVEGRTRLLISAPLISRTNAMPGSTFRFPSLITMVSYMVCGCCSIFYFRLDVRCGAAADCCWLAGQRPHRPRDPAPGIYDICSDVILLGVYASEEVPRGSWKARCVFRGPWEVRFVWRGWGSVVEVNWSTHTRLYI
ncbi:hypothetical protein K505DRAFT_59524 [Melanomma pulvis-pyrius CBS 109.77]|uniref:Uncharacterized protein n=1 Tax=Melanomma pulvis-pyrius CBS 109.77 TaxID=1314802 RepID=A0A6A6X7A2_9PLEO|nr:hypothetical protein K505DRAFT_59524 [Melanomma pulvis-pyrius CBS 109.77]